MKKLVSLLLVLVLLAGTASIAAAEDTPTLKILLPFYNAESAASIVSALEETAGVKLNIIPAAYDQWDQKVNTLMSVGEEYDILIVNTTTPWQTWAEEGLVYNLDELVDPERHPYAYKLINSDMYASYAVDGGHYYLPGVHHGQDFNMYVRQDVLDAAGIESLETIDQFYEAAKFAKENYGMYAFVGGSSEGNFEHFQPIFGAFGCGSVHPSERGFIVTEDGTVMESSRTENAKDALVFLNKLYHEDMLNKDYLSIGNSYMDMYISTDKAMSWYCAYGNMGALDANLKLINPDANIAAVEPMNKDTFVGRLGWGAMWTIAFIPSTCTNPEAAIDFFEFVNSKEGRDICVAGPAGVTCTADGVSADGVFTPIPDEIAAEWGSPTASSPMWASFLTTVYGYVPAKDYDTFEDAYTNRVIYITADDLASNSLYNTRNGLYYGGMFAETTELNTTTLPIEAEVKNTLNTLRAEYWNRIIAEDDPAQIDVLWNEYVEKWLSSGGADYEAAYQAFYDASK